VRLPWRRRHSPRGSPGAAAADGSLDPSFDAGLNEGPVVVWADGDSADKTLTLSVVDDELAEGDETVELELLPLGAPAEQGRLVLTIVDDEAPPLPPVTPEPTPVTPTPVEARPHKVFLPAALR
jgi:hypothetical protein